LSIEEKDEVENNRMPIGKKLNALMLCISNWKRPKCGFGDLKFKFVVTCEFKVLKAARAESQKPHRNQPNSIDSALLPPPNFRLEATFRLSYA
jgi:hypothetical protein